MLSITRLSPHQITAHEKKLYKKVFPSYNVSILDTCLKGNHPNNAPNSRPLILSLQIDGHPQGLLLAHVLPDLFSVEVHLLCLSPQAETGPILKDLLQYLVQETLNEHCHILRWIYVVESDLAPLLQATWKELDWPNPIPFALECRFVKANFKPPWLYYKYPLPKEMQIFSWKTLKQEERQQILHQIDQYRVPAAVSPFFKEHRIDFRSSFGIRCNGEVIGWVITHHIKPDLLHYAAIYVHSEYRHFPCGLALLSKSIQRYQTLPGYPFTSLFVNLSKVHLPWLRLIHRRLIPYSSATFHHELMSLYLK